MLALHRWRGTWVAAIDTYIALSEFARTKFVAGGLPTERIIVKPNFVSDDPGVGRHSGRYALYVGRLSPEKGIESLVRLWNRLALEVPLRIIGSGPLEHLRAEALPNIEWLGWQPREYVLAAMRDARFLVFPSDCYETFGMVLIEAMATGLPIIATNRGSVPEIVQDGHTGLLVRPGDGEHWAEALRWALSNPDAMAEMGRRARREFECKYTPEAGYRLLSEVYQWTVERAQDRVSRRKVSW
jgi:glycosyltransferase involved in cell wall biosynthesis